MHLSLHAKSFWNSYWGIIFDLKNSKTGVNSENIIVTEKHRGFSCRANSTTAVVFNFTRYHLHSLE